ncbi:alanine--tRNA ligase [Sandaracinomonas limnophila]|uniref:Alanine--tRNA ligase n=1 Tax=Sandaracinomonas limnophila TaxID=1862386 RepID=A0A437PX72_9BACT|nr:alanine--tRNA ligase [Sandaracinomonas limnophila]RVU26864.1 alanine--tRNA ligase [Sandaracinomonas limnophila]
MTSTEIRQQFLDFFKSKGHLIVPSAPLVAKNDPTLMFNNSGMAQFKDFFLGNGTPPSKRIADTQKCLRVSGKHNDLEDVGFDTYHHTMFEMLGNWSFGDYFKKEALTWSWELLTEIFKLPKDRIYVSVFEGSEAEGVPFDQEAFDIWKAIVGEDRIILGNKKDNFWEMGETGPCGPCSEIHIDLRNADEVAKTPGKSLVNADHPQVVEIWNNVFMQFERMADGSLVPLPEKHVDTGMGFERLCMAIQGKQSNYDTDVFQGTIQYLSKKCGVAYGKDNWSDIAMRVISDHIRAIAFCIADGQLPSNAKAGYVIRRILRRAVRYGYTYLNFKEPFLYELVPLLSKQFAGVFDELSSQESFVAKVIQEEEISFLRTLSTGLVRLDKLMQDTKAANKTILSGEDVFELNDTYGFPVDLTALIARENQLAIDEEGYQKALAQQKDRSRKDANASAEDWVILNDEEEASFVGYDLFETSTQVLKYQKIQNKAGIQYKVVLEETPFYAESGGQVGDIGTLHFQNSNTIIQVIDTKKENDLVVHMVNNPMIEKVAEEPLVAKINQKRRRAITQNHSATHLMQAALQSVLGKHVAQKGSLVNEEILRFDFSHFQKVTQDEILEIERLVNEKIAQNIPLLEERNVAIEDAKSKGAMALFGEKYGDFVRVITFGKDFSVELCGGTHVPATGEIGLFKIISESSVATGVRRIEAITSQKAYELLSEQELIIDHLNELLKSPKDLIKAVAQLVETNSSLQKVVSNFQQKELGILKTSLVSQIKEQNGINYLVKQIDVPNADALKNLVFDIVGNQDNHFCLLVAELEGKASLALAISKNLVDAKGLNAGNIIRELAKEVQGGGGGQPFLATAGGQNPAGLPNVLTKAIQYL